MPKLFRRTKRLIIRPLAARDYKTWWQAHNDMHPQKNIFDRRHKDNKELSLTHFKKILTARRQRMKADSFYELGVFERTTGAYVGIVTVMNITRSLSQSGYLGYALHNQHWGKGYGKESLLALIDIGFRDLKLHRLEAGIEPINRRSIMLARSVGLRKEGLKKRIVFLRDKWVDLVMYSATCEEFGFKWTGKLKQRI